MDNNIKRLFKRLSFLGYRAFEIESILRDAIGSAGLDIKNFHQCSTAVLVLEKYEKLGLDYLDCYSK